MYKIEGRKETVGGGGALREGKVGGGVGRIEEGRGGTELGN